MSDINPTGQLSPADVCVIVVSYNSADHLPALLNSLPAAAAGLALRVVVVDNDSSDDSVEVARDLDAVVVPAGGNIGYAAGINVGRRWAAGTKSVLIANPDLRFEPGSIRTMFEEAERTGDVVTPLLRGPEGDVRPSIRREPTITRQLGEALLGDRWPLRPAPLAIMVRDPRSYSQAQTVDWATGAAMMVTAACDAAVGDWDESFFLYSEEIDYARRCRGLGHRLRFEPRAEAVHAEGGSGRSSRLFALDGVNRVRYYRKYHGRASSVVYAAAIIVELLLRIRRPASRAAVGPVAGALRSVARGKSIPTGAEFMEEAKSPDRGSQQGHPQALHNRQ